MFCTFKIPLIYNRATPTSNARTTNAIPRWKKASDTQKQDYFNDLQTDLQNITIPDCKDVHCKYEQHKAAVDDLMLEVLRSVEKSANDHIPKLTDSNRKPNAKIPNWKIEIEPFRDIIRSGNLPGDQSTANYITL